MGAWSLCKKIGDSYAPRSAGCSKMYSASESLAARRRAALARVRRRDVRNSHRMVARSHGRRPSVVRVRKREMTGDRESGTRRRSDDSGVGSTGATLQKGTSCEPPPGIWVTVHALYLEAEPFEENADAIGASKRSRKQQQHFPGGAG
eukprot:2892613-Pleurochrysis_carterae.AAC.1